MTKAADADNAYRRIKTRTKHTVTCENSIIFTKSTWHYKLKFQHKLKKKLEEQKTVMKNKDGKLVETEKEVKEVYTDFYKDLLSTSVASTQKEQKAEDNVNKIFILIEIIAENQEPLEKKKKN